MIPPTLQGENGDLPVAARSAVPTNRLYRRTSPSLAPFLSLLFGSFRGISFYYRNYSIFFLCCYFFRFTISPFSYSAQGHAKSGPRHVGFGFSLLVLNHWSKAIKEFFREFFFPVRVTVTRIDIREITEIRFYLCSKNEGVEYSKLGGDEKKGAKVHL